MTKKEHLARWGRRLTNLQGTDLDNPAGGMALVVDEICQIWAALDRIRYGEDHGPRVHRDECEDALAYALGYVP